MKNLRGTISVSTVLGECRVDYSLQIPGWWDGTLVLEPANRGRSEFLALLVGTSKTHRLLPAVLTFAWDQTSCACNEQILRCSSNFRVAVSEVEPYSLCIRVGKSSRLIEVDHSLGHHPSPKQARAQIIEGLTRRPLCEAHVESTLAGHLYCEAQNPLKPGRPYILQYCAESIFDTTYVSSLVNAIVHEASYLRVPGLRTLPTPPSRFVLVGISQSGRVINSVLASSYGSSVAKKIDAVLIYGAGSCVIPSHGFRSTHDGELLVPSRHPKITFDLPVYSIFTINEIVSGSWAPARPVIGTPIYIPGVSHGDSMPLTLLRAGEIGAVEPSGLPPADRSPILRALLRKLLLGRSEPERRHGDTTDGLWQSPLEGIVKRITGWRQSEFRIATCALIRPFSSEVDVVLNEIHGIRPLELRVPLATYFGCAFYPIGDSVVSSIPGFSYVIAMSQQSDPWGRPTLGEIYRGKKEFEICLEREIEVMATKGDVLDSDLQEIRVSALCRYDLLLSIG